MESFEVTFFDKKNGLSKNNLNIFRILLDDIDLPTKKILVEFFDEEEKDYVEIRLSIFDFHIDKGNLHSIFKEISGYVSNVLAKFDTILFATGIYELTYYFTESKKRLVEFDKYFLRKFPILFFRKEPKDYTGVVLYKNDLVVCILNENAQNLY